ncbi:hypothetical protein [Vibrio kanaloae]|uniref:hypothetical protein n=1 Tax=Vibrio kanaloae TaxID=170673 RepID=UPI001EFE465B|nr:hypothetical protein [Vibrio kanaloae]MCG9557645.1 hypothetical protein [Vibrio kanaloae]
MSNQRKTPLSFIANSINERIELLENQRDEYQSNPSLTPQNKEAAANYYRGSLKELSRLRAIIGAA